jgi:hypothetical protein
MTTIRSTASHNDIEAILERIVGEECWAIIAGPGTGTVILLDLGAKLPRVEEVDNPNLSEDECKFEAPYSIQVWCAWRVEVAGRVVGSAVALPETGWWERSGLAQVRGRRLTSFELSMPIPDLRLHFGDVTLSMFADTLSEDDRDCAFTVRTSDDVYVVFANGDLQREYVELT